MAQDKSLKTRVRNALARRVKDAGTRAGVVPTIDTFPWPPQTTPAADIPAYGAQLHALSVAAQNVTPTTRWGEVYDLVKANFDYPFYLAQNPDIANQHLDPVAHYLKAGAREKRDPAPWFATGEYVNTYMTGKLARRVNPFYHYLTEGRKNGYAPRGPHGYERFSQAVGLSPVEVSDLVRARIDDVRARLAHGGLGEMVKKAAALDPLVAKSWPGAMKVRVPPASNAIGTQRIAHLLDMQDQAQNTRADLVIVSGGAGSDSEHDQLRALVTMLGGHVDPARIVVIITRPRYLPTRPLPGVRIIDYARMRPKAANYDARRSLIEIIRSLRPAHVVNHNDAMFWDAMPIFGKALAASSAIVHVISEDPFDARGGSTERALARFYRGFDIPARIATIGTGLKDRLVNQFAVPPDDAAQVPVLEIPMQADQQVQAAADGPILWLGPSRSARAPAMLTALARLHPTRRIEAFDPDLRAPTTAGGHAWEVLPDGRLPLQGAALVIVDADLDMLDSHPLDCIAAGVPLAARMSDALRQGITADLAIDLGRTADTATMLDTLGMALEDPDAMIARAQTLRDTLAARRDTACASFAILDEKAAS